MLECHLLRRNFVKNITKQNSNVLLPCTNLSINNKHIIIINTINTINTIITNNTFRINK